MPTRAFTISEASVIAAATTIIGLVVSFVPSWAPLKEALITGATTLVAVVFLVANAIHAHGKRPVVVAPAPAAAPSVPVAVATPAA